CGLAIRVGGVAGIVERVVRDEAGRIRYHYVLVDYLAFPESTRLVPGSDAADAQWIEIDRVAELDTTEGLLDMVRRAQALERGDRARRLRPSRNASTRSRPTRSSSGSTRPRKRGRA